MTSGYTVSGPYNVPAILLTLAREDERVKLSLIVTSGVRSARKPEVVALVANAGAILSLNERRVSGSDREADRYG